MELRQNGTFIDIFGFSPVSDVETSQFEASEGKVGPVTEVKNPWAMRATATLVQRLAKYKKLSFQNSYPKLL